VNIWHNKTKNMTVTKNIKIPYRRRQRAIDFDKNEKRWNGLVIHRRWGKSTHLINILQKKALQAPHKEFVDGVWAFVAPTYKQAKSIIWNMLVYYSANIPWIKVNISELSVTYPNNNQIRLFGSDSPDSLRGLKYYWSMYDEYQDQNPIIHTQIILPSLIESGWWATRSWTPKWKNTLYELYVRLVHDMKLWLNSYAMLLPASTSWILSIEQLQEARKQTTEEEYLQEFECSWEWVVKWAYYSKGISKMYSDNRVVRWIYDKTMPVYTFWDIWVSDYTCIVFIQLYWQEIRIVDYLQDNNQWLEHYSDILKSKWYNYGRHYFPHDIRVRELSTWLSRYEICKKLFGDDKCKITPNIPVMDGINAARWLFDKMWFDEEGTSALRACLSAYRSEYDEKKWIFKDSPLHDRSSHGADAFRYMAVNIKKLLDSQKFQWNEVVTYSPKLY
jgi:phage terminase large subunit